MVRPCSQHLEIPLHACLQPIKLRELMGGRRALQRYQKI
jgi:hypothetical protein